MLKSNFKIAWRNLIKDGQFSLLNLLGLSSGLACTLLIYLWVSNELQVDKFNSKDSQLYQVLKTSPNADGTISTYEYTQGLLAQSMNRELPEVEYAVAVRHQDIGILSVNDKRIKVISEFVDKDFFNVFSYQVIEGNRNSVLTNKYGVLLSDKLALKLFNTTKDIIGKAVYCDRGEFTGSYVIAGIFKSPPANASDQFDMLFTYDLYATKEAEDIAFWGSNGVSTYLILKKGTNVDAFNKKIKDFTKLKIKTLYKDNGMLQWEGNVFVQRYSDRYLYNKYENGVQAGGRIEYVKLFSIIAIFILIIACINFMNLSTAKAAKRSKEVGIRKVMGASRSSLVLQYISESILLAFSSLVIAWLLIVLLLPAFNEIAGNTITLQLNIKLILSSTAIAFVTGVIAGSYPALYLSGFQPVLVLKGKFSSSSGAAWIRKGLVVFQFSISIILIVSVLIVYQQMKLIQTTNLGYDKDNIIRFSNDGNIKNNLAPFLSELKSIPGVINASDAEGDLLGNASHSGSGIDWEGKNPNLGIEYYGISVDNDFIETMGLQMAEGRAFSKAYADSPSVIFNQSAIAAMGLKNPVGKSVSLWGHKKQIIGIIKDYHFESLYKKIGPAFITWSQNNSITVVLIKRGTELQTISRIKDLFGRYNKGLDFNYTFLDDDYNTLYLSEQRVAVLSKYFAGIAILILCLGLFGLAAFTAQRRKKEISIRKVIGASMTNVVSMLSKDFLLLVSIALVIGIPISWWAANVWLQRFAYRITVSPFVFVITAASVMIITLITISFQTIKAAIANPVKNLRTE
jgi:putative ABC transport system permease protein